MLSRYLKADTADELGFIMEPGTWSVRNWVGSHALVPRPSLQSSGRHLTNIDSGNDDPWLVLALLQRYWIQLILWASGIIPYLLKVVMCAERFAAAVQPPERHKPHV